MNVGYGSLQYTALFRAVASQQLSHIHEIVYKKRKNLEQKKKDSQVT